LTNNRLGAIENKEIWREKQATKKNEKRLIFWRENADPDRDL
jgi:hypothetical protein